nr:EAL domain-containing protein [Methylopila capsulata]
MIARGRSVRETAMKLCQEAELLAPGCLCSILRVDHEGKLRTLAAPGLLPSYSAAIDGLPTGPNVGSCGAAAYLGRPIVATDVATDPRWADFRALAQEHHLAACWASPIFGSAGKVVGTFAFYSRTPRGPTVAEQQIVRACIDLCAIAIERSDVEEESLRLAYFDSLTGLANRASFDRALDQAKGAAPGDFALLLIDVDRLKLVNDTLGHSSGDELLREVARRIAAASPEGGGYRLSGDEFAVVAFGPKSSARLQAVAHAVIQSMSVPATCGAHTVQATVTIGSASLDAPGDTADTVRQNADFALYHAKENDRGRLVAYDPLLVTKITSRFRCIRDVGEALNEGRVEPHYQPIVRLDTREIVGVEALCRIRTRTGEIVPAAAFQQAVTDATTSARITEVMLRAVARDVRGWLDADIPFQHVGLNVTTGDFQRNDLVERIEGAFGQHDVPLSHVILEVTESVYMSDNDPMVANAVRALRHRGLRVALDDFGTGFASLTHLLTFPVDVIKIDKSFVSDLSGGGPSSAIVEGLIGIAQKLKMRVVAEGVETEHQRAHLQALGCTLGQGFLFSRPSDRGATTDLLRRFAQPAASPPGASSRSQARTA